MPDETPQTTAPTSAPAVRKIPAWAGRAAWVLGGLLILYGMVVTDVILRARHAWLQGQKYERWNSNPAGKKSELDAAYEKGKKALDKKLAKGKMDKDEYDRQLEVLQFDRDFKMEESSLKYALVWYQTAYELFSPPESRWVRLSRERAASVKEEWKKELRSKNIPFEDTMLE